MIKPVFSIKNYFKKSTFLYFFYGRVEDFFIDAQLDQQANFTSQYFTVPQ